VELYGYFFRVSPADTITFEKDGIHLQIDYSRPYKKERLIFGEESEGALQPYGVYWRMGANEATKLTTSALINIEGNRLVEGSYAMYAFPGESEWTIGFNTMSDKWGAWEPDYSHDVFRIVVEPTRLPNVVEQMTMTFVDSEEHLLEIVMQWDQVEVRIPVDAN
jgi:hypothetical protein